MSESLDLCNQSHTLPNPTPLSHLRYKTQHHKKNENKIINFLQFVVYDEFQNLQKNEWIPVDKNGEARRRNRRKKIVKVDLSSMKCKGFQKALRCREKIEFGVGDL